LQAACYPPRHDHRSVIVVLKRLLRRSAVQAVLAWLLGRYLQLALGTTRWTLLGAEHFEPYRTGTPVVAAFWHEVLPLMPALWTRARDATPGLRLQVLVSRHADGRFIGDIIARFGLEVAHGSSARDGRARGGATGALSLLASLEEGCQVAITPDGPRGPRRVAAPGVAQLAGLSGRMVLPCAAASTRAVTLPSWDLMQLPLPFGRGVLVCGPAIAVARESWQDSLPVIAAALDAVRARAEQWRP
jgi:lysophospholipid acyltransferase (LPLAT)-like uncharacterized protein